MEVYGYKPVFGNLKGSSIILEAYNTYTNLMIVIVNFETYLSNTISLHARNVSTTYVLHCVYWCR